MRNKVKRVFKSFFVDNIINAIIIAPILYCVIVIFTNVIEIIPDMRFMIVPDLVLGIIFFTYIILCFWLKKLTFNNDSIEIYYYIRPFAKRYQYQYKNIVKVFYDSGIYSYFIFTVQRKRPWGIFKKKRYRFYDKNLEQARDIVAILNEKNIPISMSASVKTKRYLNGEDVKWD